MILPNNATVIYSTGRKIEYSKELIYNYGYINDNSCQHREVWADWINQFQKYFNALPAFSTYLPLFPL